MAKKPTVTTVASGYYGRTALNDNFTALRDGFDNTLSLDGSTPNAMGADLDMNSNDVLNVGTIAASDITVAGTGVTGILTTASNAAAAASTSETNAGNSATAASTSAANALTSENNAASSASSASTSETNAGNSATAAAGSATAAQETADDILATAVAASAGNLDADDRLAFAGYLVGVSEDSGNPLEAVEIVSTLVDTGTWSPILCDSAGVEYDDVVGAGFYQRAGEVVMCYFSITVLLGATTKPTGANTVYIAGFPFLKGSGMSSRPAPVTWSSVSGTLPSVIFASGLTSFGTVFDVIGTNARLYSGHNVTSNGPTQMIFSDLPATGVDFAIFGAMTYKVFE